MNANAENKCELATPLIFGTAIGSFCTLFGPVGAIAGFAVGASLGFWYDKKAEAPVKAKDTTQFEDPAKRTICH